jgi:hypothetical protein
VFRACYHIEKEKMVGAPEATLHLLIDAQRKRVSGLGNVVTQPIYPPLDLPFELRGEFTYLTIMPERSHILVTATGYPPHDPVASPMFQLRMVLDNWQSGGTAQYMYKVGSDWHRVDDAKVVSFPCDAQ